MACKAGQGTPLQGLVCDILKQFLVVLSLTGKHKVCFVKQKLQNYVADIKFQYRAREAKLSFFEGNK